MEEDRSLPVHQLPVTDIRRADSTWRVGKFVFRADFDSANLGNVRQSPASPSEFLLWTKRDCQGSKNERGTRSWFYFGLSGQARGDFVVLTIQNLNKQTRLYSADYRPWVWTASQRSWVPLANKIAYSRNGEDFQLRFSQKFESDEEIFFAFAIPFSYRDTQSMLSHFDRTYKQFRSIPPAAQQCVAELEADLSDQGQDLHHHNGNAGSRGGSAAATGREPGQGGGSGRHSSGRTSSSQIPGRPGSTQSQDRIKAAHHLHNHPAFAYRPPSAGEPVEWGRMYYNRSLLGRSVEGRRVDLITITDCYGASDLVEELPTSHLLEGLADEEGVEDDSLESRQLCQFPGKKVFFISARVHPGETPATHMFNGALAFLLRQNDARAAALRRMFVFKLVPIVNPDGVWHGLYRTDTLGQNLNRFYQGNPSQEMQPSVWAIKRQLLTYAASNSLEFYLDLHAHANKKGVFIYGNPVQGEAAMAALLYARLVALNNPVFDFHACNYTEKNVSKPDKDGMSKEGAARVAIFKETRLTHLYTVESNYNTATALNLVSPASGEHGGRCSPPCGRRFPPKFAVGVLQSVGRAFVIAALDLKGGNPWSRLPNCEHHSIQGTCQWIAAMARSPSETRVQTLPALSDACLDSLQDMPSAICLARLGAAECSCTTALQPGFKGVVQAVSRRLGRIPSAPRAAPIAPSTMSSTISDKAATLSQGRGVPLLQVLLAPHSSNPYTGYGGGGGPGIPSPNSSCVVSRSSAQTAGWHLSQGDRDCLDTPPAPAATSKAAIQAHLAQQHMLLQPHPLQGSVEAPSAATAAKQGHARPYLPLLHPSSPAAGGQQQGLGGVLQGMPPPITSLSRLSASLKHSTSNIPRASHLQVLRPATSVPIPSSAPASAAAVTTMSGGHGGDPALRGSDLSRAVSSSSDIGEALSALLPPTPLVPIPQDPPSWQGSDSAAARPSRIARMSSARSSAAALALPTSELRIPLPARPSGVPPSSGSLVEGGDTHGMGVASTRVQQRASMGSNPSVSVPTGSLGGLAVAVLAAGPWYYSQPGAMSSPQQTQQYLSLRPPGTPMQESTTLRDPHSSISPRGGPARNKRASSADHAAVPAENEAGTAPVPVPFNPPLGSSSLRPGRAPGHQPAATQGGRAPVTASSRRLFASIQASKQQQQQLTQNAVACEGEAERPSGIASTHGHMTSALEPVLGNLRVVGKLPAFRNSPNSRRRSMVSSPSSQLASSMSLQPSLEMLTLQNLGI